jgi:hypothetical protein
MDQPDFHGDCAQKVFGKVGSGTVNLIAGQHLSLDGLNTSTGPWRETPP